MKGKELTKAPQKEGKKRDNQGQSLNCYNYSEILKFIN